MTGLRPAARSRSFAHAGRRTRACFLKSSIGTRIWHAGCVTERGHGLLRVSHRLLGVLPLQAQASVVPREHRRRGDPMRRRMEESSAPALASSSTPVLGGGPSRPISLRDRAGRCERRQHRSPHSPPGCCAVRLLCPSRQLSRRHLSSGIDQPAHFPLDSMVPMACGWLGRRRLRALHGGLRIASAEGALFRSSRRARGAAGKGCHDVGEAGVDRRAFVDHRPRDP